MPTTPTPNVIPVTGIVLPLVTDPTFAGRALPFASPIPSEYVDGWHIVSLNLADGIPTELVLGRQLGGELQRVRLTLTAASYTVSLTIGRQHGCWTLTRLLARLTEELGAPRTVTAARPSDVDVDLAEVDEIVLTWRTFTEPEAGHVMQEATLIARKLGWMLNAAGYVPDGYTLHPDEVRPGPGVTPEG